MTIEKINIVDAKDDETNVNWIYDGDKVDGEALNKSSKAIAGIVNQVIDETNKAVKSVNNILVENNNISLTANDVDAYSKEESDDLTAKASYSTVMINSGNNVEISDTVLTNSFTISQFEDSVDAFVETGMNSCDFTVANNGSGYWLDRSVNQVKSDDGTVHESGSANWSTYDLTSSETPKGLSKVFVFDRSFDSSIKVYFDSFRGVENAISINEETVEFTSILKSFDNNGLTFNSLTANAKYQIYQTFYSHIQWGLTSDNKLFVEAFNNITKENMVYYIGSGNSNHTFSHSLNDVFDYTMVKNLSTDLTKWEINLKNSQHFNIINSNAINTNTALFTDENEINVSKGLQDNNWNEIDSEFILYGQCNTDYQKIGYYNGTGATGNFVSTEKKPCKLMIKKRENDGDWFTYDIERLDGTSNKRILLNDSNSEYTNDASDFSVVLSDTGFYINNTQSSLNELNSVYFYVVNFDSNLNSLIESGDVS